MPSAKTTNRQSALTLWKILWANRDGAETKSDPPQTHPTSPVSNAREKRETAGSAGNRGRTGCGNPETASCRCYQIRGRSSSADRAHLSPPNPGNKVMKRPKRDPVREGRIHNEAIVDASPDEQAMSCYPLVGMGI